MAKSRSTSSIPDELKEKLASLDTALTQIETVFQPLLKTNQSELYEKISAMEKAKLELAGVYSINSLFWVYLNICGVNPKEHGIKQELERIKSYMDRAKNIQDRAKAPRVDKSASKRFVKSALWKAAQKQTEKQSTEDDARANTPASSSQDQDAPSTSTADTSYTKDPKMTEPPAKKRRKR
ncbi:nuclear nucleic acid-binding protein C1D-like [Saccostrea echinata]|uniref:nuclear nucleic acid-binding protein C1D-like n=1 Tax=Saccostrea echinata TaxID=191078 RepID=UPI002A7EC094|nr:nuclear nucleic acid-binding protein C1D-like [Saccostrea echinata]